MPAILIQNGRLIDPANDVDEQVDILLVNGKVQQIGNMSKPSGGDDLTIINADGCIVSPGLIDIHVHFREPGQEEKGQETEKVLREKLDQILMEINQIHTLKGP